MDGKFLKPYDPSATEDRIYALWEKSGFFNPDVCLESGFCNTDTDIFSIVLPPPNATGVLHLGHALESSMQDTVVRFNRMLGKRTLWIPGSDHAAIATDAKVTKLLDKKGIKKHEIGRDEFLKHVDAFVADSRTTIQKQLRKTGGSLDWSREAFTLDAARQQAVYTAFKELHNLGLIYRGHRIVNWDPRGQTVISDDEIVREERTARFYYLKYGPFTIATARPETKFGDKYVVMHPQDSRYKNYKHGQTIELEWINGQVTATIIKDEVIDMEFGTGVMTITPWHDVTDFEIAQRHDLDKEQIIDQYGKLLPVAGEFAGMKINEAREKIVKKLDSKGLVEKIDERHMHQVATAERTGGVIEPQIMQQWFVAVNKEFSYPFDTLQGIAQGETVTLKKLMRHVVEGGDVDILPERFKKVYFHWIENLRDWCISRQIWYGHQIPVWYCSTKQESISNSQFPISKQHRNHQDQNSDKNKETFIISMERPVQCPLCGKCEMKRDPDTLDTWFSSGLWTFSTLGWPEKTNDLKTYHPTNFMNPGYEILFFWVARMILMSTTLLGQIPFKTAYLHGILRDEKGRKFSKSLGNGIDPIEVIDQYGADALRMALTVGIGPGMDSRFDIQKVKAYSKFANKLWNISRFVLENTNRAQINAELTQKDVERIEELNAFTKEITNDMETFRLYLASEKIYHYIWHTFADEIIEERKDVLAGTDKRKKQSAEYTLYTILATCLKLLHPFMPFITEEIWQELPHKERDLLMVAQWPQLKIKK